MICCDIPSCIIPIVYLTMIFVSYEEKVDQLEAFVKTRYFFSIYVIYLKCSFLRPSFEHNNRINLMFQQGLI